jgi:putative FmdB family regulatory protein
MGLSERNWGSGAENKLAKPVGLPHIGTVHPMPTYEYACSKCGHKFEQFQSMRDEPLKKCPKCKKLGLKRLIGGGAGLIFKGSGFYITDYKNKGMASAAAAESKAPAPKAAESAPTAAPATSPSKKK